MTFTPLTIPELISLIPPVVSLFCYIVLSSIEFGAAFYHFFPNLLGRTRNLRDYINPVWEVTDVFLVFFIICLLAFFPSMIYMLGENLLPIVSVALVFFGLRVACVLLIFYGNLRSRIVDGIFLVSSFAAPATLGLVPLYALTGSTNMILTLTYVSFVVVIISAIFMLSSTFFRFFNSTNRIHDKHGDRNLDFVSHVSVVVFVISVIVFAASLTRFAPYLVAGRMAGIVGLAFGAFIAVMACVTFMLVRHSGAHKHNPLSAFISAVLTVAGLYVGLFTLHMPYLIYPTLTVQNSFVGSGTFGLLMVALVVGLILTVPEICLLYYLFVFSKGRNKNDREIVDEEGVRY